MLNIKKKKSIKKTKEVNAQKKSIFFVFGRSIDIAQSILSKYSIQNHKANIIINIPRSSCEFYEFTKAYKMIQIGKMATKKEIIKNKIYSKTIQYNN